jgi:hypothetical protein
MPEGFLADIGWCWWTKPRATRIGDTVHIGGIDSSGRVVAIGWELRTRTSSRTVLATLEPDDHNNPALLAVPGRPLVALYSRHQCDDAVRLRVGPHPGGSGEWSQEQELSFGGETTYAQVHACGDELHLFTRVDDATWAYRRSEHWAQGWHPARQFLRLDTDQEIYMPTALLGDGRTLRVAVSGHPKQYRSRPLHDVWVCQVDLVTGAVTRPGDGTDVANLRDGAGLPLNQDALELVHRAPADRTVNLFDVSDGEVFEVGFVSKLRDDLSTRDARYHVTALRDGGWRTEELVAAGTLFGYIHAGFYAGGVAFPHAGRGGEVYLTREDGGEWSLERWHRDDAGTWRPQTLLGPSPTRLARPWPVAGGDDELAVVALALERYDDDYMSTLSHLVGAGARGPYPATGGP